MFRAGNKKPLTARLKDFKTANSIDSKLATASTIAEYGGADGLYLGAAATLEVACLHAEPATAKQVELFVSAGILAQRAINVAQTARVIGSSALRADQLRRDIPMLLPIYSEGILPQIEQVLANHKATLASVKLAQGARKAAHTSGRIDTEKDINGYMSELAVRLLLSRYAVNEIGDGSWLPIAAHLTSDRATTRSTMDRSQSFDLGVLTQTNPDLPIDEPYKIQVKTWHNLGPNKEGKQIEYADDIIVVTPTQISERYEKNPSFQRVLLELQAEDAGMKVGASHLSDPCTILDRRANLLINHMG